MRVDLSTYQFELISPLLEETKGEAFVEHTWKPNKEIT